MISRSNTIDHSEILDRITNLEKLDRNGDSVVTKEEFEQWVKEQRESVKEYTEKETGRLSSRIAELEKENKSLKTINKKLETILAQVESKEDQTPVVQENQQEPVELLGPESQKTINRFVEELLQDPNINISYFPDQVERQLYRNVFNLSIGLLNKIVTHSRVDLLGHSITLKLEATEK